jgi:ATP-dependent DNA helicase RecG
MAGKGLETEVQFLKGVGPKSAMLLQKLGLHTVRDVLWYMPRRMEDRSQIPPIMRVQPGIYTTVIGTLEKVESRPIRGGRVIVTARVADDMGEIDLVFFNQPWTAKELNANKGRTIIAYGMVKEGNRRLEMTSPEWEGIEDEEDAGDFARIVPVYGLKEGVPQKTMRRAARAAVEFFAPMIPEPLPEWLRKEFRQPKLAWSISQMHLPGSDDERQKGRTRIVFDEFLSLQIMLQLRRRDVKQEIGIAFPISDVSKHVAPAGTLFGEKATQTLWDDVRDMLPFELTGAQKRVVKEVWADMENSAPMNRLVQGDVGSGKTAVAAAAILAAVRCGYQAALMAPTEILAEQHGLSLKKLFEPLGINVVLLVGKLNAAQKRKALQQAESGEARVCIGTHALIQEGVKFQKLGLAVIDEQHRFGVLQRMALRQKGYGHPDVLVMTATPIPRTLTMSIYGDLDLSVIDELPPGRKPIKTHWKRAASRDSVYQTVRSLIAEGRQAYFVCPMITESDKMQTQAAEDLYYRLQEQVFPDLRVGLLHGQMKSVDKEAVMDQFRAHELDVLVSTVVIEVGVDVPNASVMVIEDAYRFGLAQLHQLRGRVGRGEHQSYCILISDAKTTDSEQRLRIMEETTDGFRIAEEDLKLRGPGDVAGTRQAGQLDFLVADLLKDGAMLETAKQAAIMLLERDPELSDPAHALILESVRARRSDEALLTIS